jgi:phospholipid/cholesterol/gamma-HCH transport system substrate-binding protein
VTNGAGKTVVVRRFQGKLGPVRAGLIAALLVVIATYLAFSKSLPWQDPFEVKAVFSSVNSIRLDSPVRIAGVEVGQVTKVEHYEDSNYGVVTMRLEDNGRPIHKDATLKIRPRLFLEGNFFIDMTSGTPEAPVVEDGDTIPVTQTAYPVQLDQLLTSLQEDTRKNLQDLLAGFGGGLTYRPRAADDVGQDPAVRGKSAAEALNSSLASAGPAFKNAARVNNALLGTQSHDLRKLVAGLQKFSAGLGRNEERLKSFFTNFNTTMAALASEQQSLGDAIRLLGPTLQKADSYFADFARALPPTTEFVHNFIPVVRETPATIKAAGPWLTQFTALASRSELGGLLEDLRPMTANFARVVVGSISFNQQTDLTSRCFADVVLPSGDVVLQDGAATTGAPTFKEFWYSMVGLAGQSQNFDGNGEYLRVQTGGGPSIVQTGKIPNRGLQDNTLFGNAIAAPLGTRPRKPAKRPPKKPKFPCYKNQPPNLNGPVAQAGGVEKVVGTK